MTVSKLYSKVLMPQKFTHLENIDVPLDKLYYSRPMGYQFSDFSFAFSMYKSAKIGSF